MHNRLCHPLPPTALALVSGQLRRGRGVSGHGILAGCASSGAAKLQSFTAQHSTAMSTSNRALVLNKCCDAWIGQAVVISGAALLAETHHWIGRTLLPLAMCHVRHGLGRSMSDMAHGTILNAILNHWTRGRYSVATKCLLVLLLQCLQEHWRCRGEHPMRKGNPITVLMHAI